MKRNELKQILKPLIRECIREVIFEEGALSGIISEVVNGLHTAPVIQEQKRTLKAPRRQPNNDARRKILESIGKDAYNGVDIFENTEPIRNAGVPGQASVPSPLGDRDPADPGIDINRIFGGMTGTWNKLLNK